MVMAHLRWKGHADVITPEDLHLCPQTGQTHAHVLQQQKTVHVIRKNVMKVKFCLPVSNMDLIY